MLASSSGTSSVETQIMFRLGVSCPRRRGVAQDDKNRNVLSRRKRRLFSPPFFCTRRRLGGFPPLASEPRVYVPRTTIHRPAPHRSFLSDFTVFTPYSLYPAHRHRPRCLYITTSVDREFPRATYPTVLPSTSTSTPAKSPVHPPVRSIDRSSAQAPLSMMSTIQGRPSSQISLLSLHSASSSTSIPLCARKDPVASWTTLRRLGGRRSDSPSPPPLRNRRAHAVILPPSSTFAPSGRASPALSLRLSLSTTSGREEDESEGTESKSTTAGKTWPDYEALFGPLASVHCCSGATPVTESRKERRRAQMISA
ncbi:hypothetical protein OF83DRAFT_52752 [Amylostereum chailletii]|nr:hypothetical protein OF83DRAFT_52752 [Amylostereum chailletii]